MADMKEIYQRLAEIQDELDHLTEEQNRLLKRVTKTIDTRAYGMRREILAHARKRGQKTFTILELYNELSPLHPQLTKNKLSASVSRLYKEGRLIREARGQYRLGNA
jgi:predicted transcriptional regulator of viral defense system